MRNLFVAALMAASAALTASCGNSDDLGADIGIKITPETGILIQSTTQSCLDVETNTQVGNTTISRTVGSAYVRFNNFQVEWRSMDKLYVYQVGLTLQGGLFGTPVTVNLTSEELEVLLGRTGGLVEVRKTYDANKVLKVPLDQFTGAAVATKDAKVLLQSNITPKPTDFGTEATTPGKGIVSPKTGYACGLAFGGFSVPDGSSSFTAQGTITILGVRTDADGNEKPVRQTTTSTVTFTK